MNKQKETRTDEGYSAGFHEGYRYGGCQAVLDRITPPFPVQRDLRILYVPQGFEAIDDGVTGALRQLTKECIVASPESMLQEAASLRPDLVLVMNALHVFPKEHASQISAIREMGIRTAVWFVDDPYFTDDTYELSQCYDVVFTQELECVSVYRSLGCAEVHYLPLAADPERFRPVKINPEYQYDVCFIGNAFWNRVQLFDDLAPFLQDKKVLIAGGHWDRLTKYDQLSRFIRSGWMEVEETVACYNGAKIVINIHRPVEAGQDNRNGYNIPACSINPRTFEISGCGTLQITDIRQDLYSLYRPGYDIETYKDAAELEQKIDYYLNHEQERMHIAWRSLWTTRQHHTFIDRAQRLIGAVFRE